MLVGVPKEIKTHEYRVGMVPGSVLELVRHGHKVIVETKAGIDFAATHKDRRSVDSDEASPETTVTSVSQ